MEIIITIILVIVYLVIGSSVITGMEFNLEKFEFGEQTFIRVILITVWPLVFALAVLAFVYTLLTILIVGGFKLISRLWN